MEKIFYMLLVLSLLRSEQISAVTLYSQGNGNWTATNLSTGTPNLFNTATDGTGTYYDGNSDTEPFDIIIQTSHSISAAGNINCSNINIESGADIHQNLFDPDLTLNVKGNNIIVNGQLGGLYPNFSTSAQDITLWGVLSVPFTISGSGTITVERLFISSSELNIDTDIHLYEPIPNSVTLYNFSACNININSGKSLNIYGDFSPDLQGHPGAISFPINPAISYDIFVNGSLNIRNGNLCLRADLNGLTPYNIQINSGGQLYTEQYIYGSGDPGDPSPISGDSKVLLTINGTWETVATNPIQYLDNLRSKVTMSSGSSVIFSGGTDQQIKSNVVSSGYSNIELAGTGDKILDGNIILGGDMTFTSAGLKLGDYNLRSIKNIFGFIGNPFSGYSETNFIHTDGMGEFQMILPNGNIGQGILCPLGNSTYNPAYIYNEGLADVINVRVEDALYLNGVSGTPANVNSVNRTWHISGDTPGNANLGLFLYWQSADELPGFLPTNTWISHHDGSSWDQMPPAAAGTVGNQRFISRNNITNFSPFGVVSSSTILPVELIDFSARQKQQIAQLNWTTASEKNNAGFIIEHSADGYNFSKLDFVSGKGTTNEFSRYEYFHKTPLAGRNYYRLRQIDEDGHFELSDMVSLYFKSEKGSDNFLIYPNISVDILHIKNIESNNTSSHFSIYNATGILVQKFQLDNSYNTIQIHQLPSGSYFIQKDGTNKIEKFIKQ